LRSWHSATAPASLVDILPLLRGFVLSTLSHSEREK
jgi:hypothetical protein